MILRTRISPSQIYGVPTLRGLTKDHNLSEILTTVTGRGMSFLF